MDLPRIFWIAFALALRPLCSAANSTEYEPFTTTDDSPSEQTTISPEDTTPLGEQGDVYLIDKIFSIEYQIVDGKIPKLMADLINTNSFQYSIATQDLVNVLGLQHVTYSNLTRLMDELDFEVGRVDLEEAFGAFNLSVIEFLKVIVTNIPDAKSSTPKILTNFGIDPSEYIWITNFENDTSMFNLLSNGNYTGENFAYALSLANMTEEDVLNLLRPTILQHVNSKNVAELLGFLSQYDLPQRLDVIFDVLNVNAGSFYDDPIFSGILANLSAILNGEDVLAVAVQESELLTVLGVQTKWCSLDSFAVAYVTSLQNRSLRYQIEDVRNNSMFSLVSIEEVLGSYFRKAEHSEYSSENYVNCQCVSKIGENEFYFTEVLRLTLEGDVLHGNSIGTICSLGGPLICSNSLYGLSINAVRGSPKFLTFRTQSIPPPFIHDETAIVLITDPIVETSSSGGLITGGLVLPLLVLLTFTTIVYAI